MLGDGEEADKGRRFREAALPHLDALYTVARYITRNVADAEDAVQECYLRAFRYFDGVRGKDIKPWLMAILRNVCRAEYARRSNVVVVEPESDGVDHGIPLWHEEQQLPEGGIVRAAQSIAGAVPRGCRAQRYRGSLVPGDRAGSGCSHRDCDVSSGPRAWHVTSGVAAPPKRRSRRRAGSCCGAADMRCEQSSILLHAFLDGELDARHGHEFEAHLTMRRRIAGLP
jgi:hypothetical protein